MTASKMTYQKAVKELEDIVQTLSQGQVDIDQLAERIQRAKELLGFCKERLYKVNAEVNEILEK